MTSASQTPANTKAALATLWRLAGQPEAALDAVTLTGSEPALPSSFAIGTAAQASIAASALAAAELWRLRTGRAQQVSVDMRDAAIEFRSERYMRRRGQAPARSGTRSQGSIAAATGAGCGCTRTFRIIATARQAARLRLLARGRAARARGLGSGKIRDGRRGSRTGRHDDALVCRMGRAPAGARRRAAAGVLDREDRRRTATAAATRRPAALGRARARPHARHRGPGVRTHAHRPRRRRDAGHRAASTADDAAGDGQWARQALDLHRPAEAQAGATRLAASRATPTFSCRATGRAP